MIVVIRFAGERIESARSERNGMGNLMIEDCYGEPIVEQYPFNIGGRDQEIAPTRGAQGTRVTPSV